MQSCKSCLLWFCPRRGTGHPIINENQLPVVENQFDLQIFTIGQKLHVLFWIARGQDPYMLDGKFIIVIISYKTKCILCVFSYNFKT